MDIFSIILVVSGLILFETISSIDNAIINAQILSTMGEKAKKWFLTWGLFTAVFLVRGLLPWMIIWLLNFDSGPLNALTATFSNDPSVAHAIEQSAPILLIGGGIFLIFLFFHWLFVEDKHYGIRGERFIHRHSPWFYATVSLILTILVWLALQEDPYLAFGAVVGSTVFFIIHGFRQNAEEAEKELMDKKRSDLSKLFYLQVIDTTFSIDGVLGAFAFTLSVPLILLGNGIGAFIVRELTVRNISRVNKYIYLKNGAMYSILCLGVIMVLESFHLPIPIWLSPLITFSFVGYFFFRSKQVINQSKKVI